MTVKEAAKSFDDQRKRCRTLYLIYGIGMLAALAMMFLQEMKSALLIFALLLLIYFVIVRSSITQYTARWREYCARKFAESHFESVTYRYRAKADDVPAFTRHVLMPRSAKGRLLARSLVTGSRAGMDAVLMDATIPTGEGTGTRFHSGCWMGFTFHSRLGETLRVLKEEVLPGGAYERWLTESEGLQPCASPENMPEGAAFYSASGQAQLPENALSALKSLLRAMPGSGIIDMNSEGLFVFLPHRLINKLPPSLKFPITEAMIDQVTFPEIDEAYLLALNLRKAPAPKGGDA